MQNVFVFIAKINVYSIFPYMQSLNMVKSLVAPCTGYLDNTVIVKSLYPLYRTALYNGRNTWSCVGCC